MSLGHTELYSNLRHHLPLLVAAALAIPAGSAVLARYSPAIECTSSVASEAFHPSARTSLTTGRKLAAVRFHLAATLTHEAALARHAGQREYVAWDSALASAMRALRSLRHAAPGGELGTRVEVALSALDAYRATIDDLFAGELAAESGIGSTKSRPSQGLMLVSASKPMPVPDVVFASRMKPIQGEPPASPGVATAASSSPVSVSAAAGAMRHALEIIMRLEAMATSYENRSAAGGSIMLHTTTAAD